MIEKNYELTPEQAEEVEKVLAEGQALYGPIAHIIWESDFDPSIFFEDEYN